jgi:hypothetical protein
MRCLPLLLLLITAIAAAQSADADKPAHLEGHVVSTTGEPVKKATVVMQGSQFTEGQPLKQFTYVETSDSSGAFVFPSLPTGFYILSAERTGFSANATRPDQSMRFPLSDGDVRRDIEIKMVPLAAISGRVVDQEGDPLSDLAVAVIHGGYGGAGRLLFATLNSAMTDDRGEFRIGNLEAGRYYVIARKARNQPVRAVGEIRWDATAPGVDVNTFYPSGLGFKEATPVDLTPGAELRGIDIHMRRSRVYSIGGKIVDATTGKPSTLTATIIPKNDVEAGGFNFRNVTPRAPDGDFDLPGFLPGDYFIQVNPNNNQRLTCRTEVTVGDSDVEGVVCSLSTAAEITGRISAENGDLAALLRTPEGRRPPPTAPRATLEEIDQNLTIAGSPSKDDGTFTIENIAPAKYWVRAIALPLGTYAKSIRFGEQDVMNTPIDLTSGAGGKLDVVLSTKVAAVNAQVRNSQGQPAASAFVLAWPKVGQGFNLDHGRTVTVGRDGTAPIRDLAPGEYYVAAWEQTDPFVWQNPEFLAKIESHAKTVRLAESAQESVDLTVIPKDEIEAEASKLR